MKPSMLSFFTHFKVDLEQHRLKPNMAQVNHNILNETTWINIAHTFMGNFCHEAEIDTTPMEHMGHDACAIEGCHKKVSKINRNEQRFPKWNSLLIMCSNF